MADGLLSDPSVDIDIETGQNISGWPHVVQCIGDFFSTSFGERVMREWYGTAVPAFLGQQLNTETVVTFFAAMAAAITQWEPRFRVTKVTPESVGRDGKLSVVIEGEYRPRALLGDFMVAGSKKVTIFSGSSGSIGVNA